MASQKENKSNLNSLDFDTLWQALGMYFKCVKEKLGLNVYYAIITIEILDMTKEDTSGQNNSSTKKLFL